MTEIKCKNLDYFISIEKNLKSIPVEMKNKIIEIDELNKAKIPVVRINKKLEEFRGKILFPKKLALANEMLSKAKLPILETSK